MLHNLFTARWISKKSQWLWIYLSEYYPCNDKTGQYVPCHLTCSSLFQSSTTSSANATPEFEGRGGEELGTELTNTLYRAFNNKHSLDLKSLCISPGEHCWVLYVDVLVSLSLLPMTALFSFLQFFTLLTPHESNKVCVLSVSCCLHMRESLGLTLLNDRRFFTWPLTCYQVCYGLTQSLANLGTLLNVMLRLGTSLNSDIQIHLKWFSTRNLLCLK